MTALFSVEELRVAQKYPFSNLAKRVIKDQDFSLDKIPDSIISRAKLMILTALKNKQYNPKILSSSTLLKEEIISYPVAKIFISLMDNEDFTYRFSKMISKNVFSNLEREKNEIVFDIASDLKLKFSIGESEESFVLISLKDFLQIDFGDYFKLVNQRVEAGKVILSRNSFLRFISFIIEKQLLDLFPMNVSSVPKNLKSIAQEISVQSFEAKKADLKELSFGKVKPELFPPCIEKLYKDILGGRNLAHQERFVLATYGLSVGMDVDQVVHLYSYTPNFNKKITTYQVTRLAGRGGTKYSAASCSKMAEYQLRLPHCPCNANKRIKHPLQFYKNQIFKEKNPTS